MATERLDLTLDLLADLARGGFAEKLTSQQRRAIHMSTELDDFLEAQLDAGKQVILTGNPGDGKTQYIFQNRPEYPEPEYYYLQDASEWDYDDLLEEWSTAVDEGKPGILAINDGPLYEMSMAYDDEYPFLQTIEEQFRRQTIFEASSGEPSESSQFVVVDLHNRGVLTRKIIMQALDNLTDDTFLTAGHDHAGTCHIQYNIQKLRTDPIRQNLIELLMEVGKLGDHVTIRDLLNFIAYCITGGRAECDTDNPDRLHYYNLSFDGEGKIFTLLIEHLSPTDLTHPFIDAYLWASAEKAVNPRDVEDQQERISAEFLREKRRFYFEDEMIDLAYSSRDLYHEIDYLFNDVRNDPDGSREIQKERLIEMVNGYFRPGSSKRSELRLWLSHNFRSKRSQVLVSRTTIPKTDLEYRKPRLHPRIEESMSYTPLYFVLEYTGGETPVRLRFTSALSRSLRALDATVPYIVREREEEQQLLEFMEEVEYQVRPSESEGTVLIKDTETGDVERVGVHDDRYRVEGH
ncbi:UNVERIFIED_CONTAM: hypothetical protein BEN50_18365 [Euhalothece sp. KZN 001]